LSTQNLVGRIGRTTRQFVVLILLTHVGYVICVWN